MTQASPEDGGTYCGAVNVAETATGWPDPSRQSEFVTSADTGVLDKQIDLTSWAGVNHGACSRRVTSRPCRALTQDSSSSPTLSPAIRTASPSKSDMEVTVAEAVSSGAEGSTGPADDKVAGAAATMVEGASSATAGSGMPNLMTGDTASSVVCVMGAVATMGWT